MRKKNKAKKECKSKPKKKAVKKSKNRKLSSSFLKTIEKKLLEEKDRILELVNITKKEEENLVTGVEDEVENASDSLEKEILFALSDREKTLLNDILHALKKIKQKKYGVCEACGKEISLKRLKAIPYTRYCINCASKF